MLDAGRIVDLTKYGRCKRCKLERASGICRVGIRSICGKFQRGVVAVGGDRTLGKVRFEQRTKRVEGIGGDLNRALIQGVSGDLQKEDRPTFVECSLSASGTRAIHEGYWTNRLMLQRRQWPIACYIACYICCLHTLDSRRHSEAQSKIKGLNGSRELVET